MSTPEELQSQEREDALKQSETERKPLTKPMDVEAAVRQLRMLVCGLGAGLFVVSLGLSAFVFKQNRNLTAEINMRQQQITQLQANQQPLVFALNELGKFSVGKPDLMAIFARHGIQITSPSEAGPTAPKPPAPAPVQ